MLALLLGVSLPHREGDPLLHPLDRYLKPLRRCLTFVSSYLISIYCCYQYLLFAPLTISFSPSPLLHKEEQGQPLLLLAVAEQPQWPLEDPLPQQLPVHQQPLRLLMPHQLPELLLPLLRPGHQVHV